MQGVILKTVTHEALRIALKVRSVCLVDEQYCCGLLLPTNEKLNASIAGWKPIAVWLGSRNHTVPNPGGVRINSDPATGA